MEPNRTVTLIPHMELSGLQFQLLSYEFMSSTLLTVDFSLEYFLTAVLGVFIEHDVRHGVLHPGNVRLAVAGAGVVLSCRLKMRKGGELSFASADKGKEG